MSSIIIDAFLFDDENEDEFATHGISAIQVEQLLENESVILPNRRKDKHKATHLLIGRDNGGGPKTVPIEPTHEAGVWRPVTAWVAKTWDLAELENRGI